MKKLSQKTKNIILWVILIYAVGMLTWGLADSYFIKQSKMDKIDKGVKYNSEMILGHDTIFSQIRLDMEHLNTEFDTIKIMLKKAE